jgi:chromosome segregation ATPase
MLPVASVDIESLLARLAAMEARVGSLEAELSRKDGFIVYQQERIDKLEAALEESRRRSKRLGAPFSVTLIGGRPWPAQETASRSVSSMPE